MENQFHRLHLNSFANIDSYCLKLKTLSDQLANIDHLVSEKTLVLRLVAGLVGTDYDTVATIIQQTNPLPIFEEACSRLQREENRRSNNQGRNNTSFVAQQPTLVA